MIDSSKVLIADILTEQFIPDHVFFYVEKGVIHCYDGDKNYTFKEGDFCIARKNRLARYTVENTEDEFEVIMLCLEETFFINFQEKHKIKTVEFKSTDTFVKILKTELLQNYINSLKPYYNGGLSIKEAFQEVKYEELILILLQNQPELAGIFFDFGPPEKLNIEAFMNKNYAFNVNLERFAYLTGRSLSAFKRDFKDIFNDTPSRWLTQKRLQEAYFLIDKKNKRPSEIYLDLGFEALSHFSFAFKKHFGLTPSELIEKNTSR
ncbi:AraC-like DNA-binding protein [Tenacibaculum adriaticum]|uniref:AraC-like DNA-binding protein n=1 Tax=Tenacibaculum adriaticum TaxID=413713 RepID=A0A5S5DP34_9FLAO|nr:AraC family transcriptional regulator [Tenacibaculum adriaticum]TYP97485.1 AraC-like DNA-binding protein [Tenacibaculum adriaticum]